MHLKCVECGRSRLFYKLSKEGLCAQCVEEAEKARLQEEQRKIEEKRLEEQRQKEEQRRLEKERQEQERKKLYEEKMRQYEEMLAGIDCVEITTSTEPAKIILLKDQPEISFSSITSKTSLNNLGNYVVVDVETTGLQPSKCEIIDLAAIRFHNFEPVEKFCTLLSTNKPIPPEAQDINHITDEMVSGMPKFQDIAASLINFIGKDNLVGHNLGFDLDFIVRYGADVTVQKRKYYDTLDIARKTVKKERIKERWDKDFGWDYDVSEGVENYKLETLCNWYDILNMHTHRAEGDALATGLLFKKLVYEKLKL